MLLHFVKLYYNDDDEMTVPPCALLCHVIIFPEERKKDMPIEIVNN